jgi:hypothetical protein
VTDNTHADMRALASGVKVALAAMYGGKVLEFMLIVAVPTDDEHVVMNTITEIQDPFKVRMIGEHLIAMSTAQAEQALHPDDDNEVQGHA